MEFIRSVAKNKLLLIILLIAFALRLYGISNMGLGVDEALTITQAKDFSQIFYLAKIAEFSPPLYYFIVSSIFQIFNDFIFIRLFSVLMGILLVFLIYLVSYELFGEKAALIAALLATINPSLIAYSHLMRNYAFFFVLIFLIIIFTKRYSEKRKGLLPLAASNVLLLLTTYLGFLVLAAECLILKLNKVKKMVIVSLLAIVFVFLLPIASILIERTQEYSGRFAGRYFFNLGMIAVDFLYMLYKFSVGGLTIKTIISLSPLLFMVIPIVLFLFFKGVWLENGKLTILHYFLFVPAIIAFILSLLGSPILTYKYSSYLLPIFIIFAANGAAKIKNGRVQAILLALVAICWLFSDWFFYSVSTASDWNAYLGV